MIEELKKFEDIEILNHDYKYITYKCKICNAIRTVEIKSIFRNSNKTKAKRHNQQCTTYHKNRIAEEIGYNAMMKLSETYRYVQSRCCNPKDKDYKLYKGKMKFEDRALFLIGCEKPFKEALKKYDYKDLSIDRIDTTKGYELNNIRFVPMKINLQNKTYVKPVKMFNIETGCIIIAKSFGELAKKYKSIKYVSSLHRAFKNKKPYKKVWYIEYLSSQTSKSVANK